MRFTRARVSPATIAEARSESVSIAAGYFWYYGGVGTFSPFAAIYYRHLGFDGLQLGLLTAMPAIGIALTGPVWGIFADTYGIHRQILRVVLLIAAMLSLTLSQITSYGPFLLVLALISLALVPVPSLWDSYAVSAVERGGASYGVLRIFGSAGYSIVVTIMGRLLVGGISNIIFFAYAVSHVITCLVSLRLPPLNDRVRRRFWDGISLVLQKRSFLLILFTAFLIAIGYSMLGMYLAVHVASLGGSTGLAGIAYATSAMSELPIIGFGSRILRRLGARNVIFVSITMYTVRFALLGFSGSTVGVIAAQTLHGASFGMFLIASVTLAYRLVGRENAATAQAMLAMMGVGLGNIVGSLLGGVMIDLTTTSIMYRWVMLLMIFTMVVFFFGSRLVGRDAFDPDYQSA